LNIVHLSILNNPICGDTVLVRLELFNTGTTILTDKDLCFVTSTEIDSIPVNFQNQGANKSCMIASSTPYIQPNNQSSKEFKVIIPPAEFVGDTISFALTDLEGDSITKLESILLCSYDPNDKQASPLGKGDASEIIPNNLIEYKIRFQNTGNFPAQDVVLLDTIDINTLDISTFEFISSSHPLSSICVKDEVLQFNFYDIFLPDSLNNEPESHGYIYFKIDQLDELPNGTVISNKAAIYFDSNPPIITNEVSRQVERISTNIGKVTDEELFTLYPNPVGDYLIIETQSLEADLTIFNSSGQIITHHQNIQSGSIDMRQLNSGIYFCLIEIEGQNLWKKILKR